MKINLINAVLVLIALFSLAACGNCPNPASEFAEIKADSVYALLHGPKDKIIVIDVRTEPEYYSELGHIPGTILRPVQEIDNWIKEFESVKDNKFIMVCRSGNRSGVASQILKENGFKDVTNIIGGMRAWNALNLPKSAPELIDKNDN